MRVSLIVKPSRILIAALYFLTAACTEEGHTPECGMGGRASFENEKCVTPIGGSCLTREAFEESRPDPSDEDWAEYREKRPHCYFSAEDGG